MTSSLATWFKVENAELPLVTTVINMICVMGMVKKLNKKVCRGERKRLLVVC